MAIEGQLFIGQTIRLGPIDYDRDPQVIAGWSRDPRYLSLTDVRPVAALTPGAVQKQLEAIEKEMEESKTHFYFTIRGRADGRLLGAVAIRWIEWNHGAGWVQLGIGDQQDRRKGYGAQALDLLLEYAFDELNLYRLGAEIFEFNQAACSLFEKAGFQLEVRRRQALGRAGRQWDILLYGLLRQEWQGRRA